MKIAIDGSRFSKAPMGVTDICISIINSYTIQYPEYVFFIITHGTLHPDVAAKLALQKNAEIVEVPLHVFKNNSFLWTLLKFNFVLKRLKPDVLIAPNFWINTFLFPRNVKVVLYVHDVVYAQFRNTMNLITKFQMDLFFISSLKRATIIWTNSQYTKTEFLKYYPQFKGKKFLVGGSLNPGFLKRLSIIKNSTKNVFFENHGYGKKYLLFVGTFEPRKNINFLLKLFKEIANQGYYLVIVGATGWGTTNSWIKEEIESSDFPADRTFVTGYISTDQLIVLYKDALVFISTSLNEGLGLPLLEAMACGCPVIAPHNSAMIEVAYDAGITVNTWNISDWKNAIREVEMNKGFFVKRGYQRVSEYSWVKVLKQLNSYLSS